MDRRNLKYHFVKLKNFRRIKIKGFFLDIILSGIEDAIIKPLDKIEVLLSDPEIDGKKAGYERAAREYEVIYKELKQEHREIMEQIEKTKNEYDTKNDKLIDKRAQLEEKRDALRERVRCKEERVSEKYGMRGRLIWIENCMKSGRGKYLVIPARLHRQVILPLLN